MTTKEKIIEAVSKAHGGFVDTDGAWCMTRTAAQFKEMLEKEFGFKVTACAPATGSTAVATTSDGLKIAWNGYCRKI